jgi:Flp pilus assembly protein TadG
MRLIARLVPDAWRREDGTAAMEFVLVVPVILLIFMASFESGLLMTREILLEQSVDMTMRELRLGHYAKVTNVLLKQEICSRTIIFPNCESNIKIQLDRVNTTDWNFPATPTACVNQGDPAEPVTSLKYGDPNDLMLIRVCIALPAMFPGTGLALNMQLDPSGDYALVARSAFVVEPI